MLEDDVYFRTSWTRLAPRVARALAADPAILLLDEPFGALDPITRSEIQKEFRALQKRVGKTMLFVTHDVREAFILGDRIGLIKDGRLIALVPAGDFRDLDHPEARAFTASLAESNGVPS